MHDIAIIGGGPVGLAAALAAHAQGLTPVVFEAKPDDGGHADPRVFALSYGARLILERLGVWHAIGSVHPIRQVHVSQRARFGHTVLDASELGIDALGYVSAYADLVRTLRDRTMAAGIDVVTGARVVALEPQPHLVGIHFEQGGEMRAHCAHVAAQADGGASLFAATGCTERDYGQCAIVAEVRCSRAVSDHAYERFTGRGPIALLPLGAQHALIWTVPAQHAQPLLELEAPLFERQLEDAYGERIGSITLASARASFKLMLRFAHKVVSERHVLIGNAAQALHPVAGQGFNIGLRDAFELAQTLAECREGGRSPLDGLRRYRSMRRLDRIGGTLFTHFLVRTFSNEDPVLALGRSLGLFLLDASGPAKRFLMRRMIFGNPA